MGPDTLLRPSSPVSPGGANLSEAALVRVADRFRALADPSRLALLQLLADGERSVNAIAEASGLSQANASKHLAVLCAAGFIARRKEGTRVVYALASETPRLLCDLVCREVQAQVEREHAAVTARPEPR